MRDPDLAAPVRCDRHPNPFVHPALVLALAACQSAAIGCSDSVGSALPIADAGPTGADASATDAGPSGVDGGSTVDAGPIDPEACQVVEDGRPDLTYETVRFQGRVTVDGRPLPDMGLSVRNLWIQSTAHASASTQLPIHDGRWDLRLPPGRYAVRWLSWMHREFEHMPDDHSIELGTFTVLEDKSIDIDLKTTLVELERQTAGDDEPLRGAWRFRRRDGSQTIATAHFEQPNVRLTRGTYDVDYTYQLASSVQTHVATRTFDEASATLSVQVPDLVPVDLTVLVNGRPAEESELRGQLMLTGNASPLMLVHRGTTTVLLPPGAYELYVLQDVPPWGQLQSTWRTTLTVSTATRATARIDIPFHQITGRLTIDGAPATALGPAAARLSLAPTDLNSIEALPLDTEGEFVMDVVEGEYRFFYSGCCQPGGLPSGHSGTVDLGLRFQVREDSRVDVDLASMEVDVRITIDGKPPPRGAGAQLVHPGEQRPSSSPSLTDGRLRGRFIEAEYQVVVDGSYWGDFAGGVVRPLASLGEPATLDVRTTRLEPDLPAGLALDLFPRENGLLPTWVYGPQNVVLGTYDAYLSLTPRRDDPVPDDFADASSVYVGCMTLR